SRRPRRGTRRKRTGPCASGPTRSAPRAASCSPRPAARSPDRPRARALRRRRTRRGRTSGATSRAPLVESAPRSLFLPPKRRQEPQHVRRREREAAEARVQPHTEVRGQVERQALEPLVGGRRTVELALAGEREGAEGGEEVDAEHRAHAAVERNAV